LLYLICIGFSLLTGCGREFAEVTGTVTLDGKPLDHVEVQFLPDPDKGNAGPTACAYTDDQGRYQLRCDRANRDGTVVGPHRVCVIDITMIAGPGGSSGGAARRDRAAPGAKAKGPRVPPAYSSVTHTPLRDIDIRPGSQVMNFDIPSPEPAQPEPEEDQ
jgi:hypothetical protein